MVGGLAGLVVGQSDDGVDGHLYNLLRGFLCHLLYLHSALAAHHDDGLLGLAVDEDADVILRGDVGGLGDEDSVHDEPLDGHAENLSGIFLHLLHVVGQLHAAGLSAASGVHLRLHYGSVHAQFLVSLNGFSC